MTPTDLSARPMEAGDDRGVLAWIYDPKIRGMVFQIALLLGLVFLLYSMVTNTAENLAAQDKRSGFGFLFSTANFAVLSTPGTYVMGYQSGVSAYWEAFLVGIINTLAVSLMGVMAATLIGFVLGVFRLSSNVVLRGFATIYVETLRNIPVLLQFFVWYKVLGEFLPTMRDEPWSAFWGAITMDISGVRAPFPLPQEGFSLVIGAFLAAIVAAFVIRYWARRRKDDTGQDFPTFWVNLALIILVPLIVFYAIGGPLEWETPQRSRFGFRDGFGLVMKPEMFAVWLALTLYTAAFIAEIVRAGILAVHKGQTEAAYALGMRPQTTLNLIVIPQALRVIIPPLTSQYLNLTKNSSLAVAIGYPDLYSLSGIINQKVGQEVEVIVIIMSVYLTFSILISLFMNWYNRRIALIER